MQNSILYYIKNTESIFRKIILNKKVKLNYKIVFGFDEYKLKI